ncbi:hypothetical protein [Rhizobium leguminosarum]|nr:hypothetical protein [Rhizobium leguminosarum]
MQLKVRGAFIEGLVTDQKLSHIVPRFPDENPVKPDRKAYHEVDELY